MSDKKSDIVMQGQNGDFRGGNCEEVTAVVKEKTKIKAVRFGSNTLNTVCEECFDSSVVSSPPPIFVAKLLLASCHVGPLAL
jgi:hypothetical protein